MSPAPRAARCAWPECPDPAVGRTGYCKWHAQPDPVPEPPMFPVKHPGGRGHKKNPMPDSSREWAPTITHAQYACLTCGRTADAQPPTSPRCPHCGGTWIVESVMRGDSGG